MLLHQLPTEVLMHILASALSLSDLRALASTSQRIYSIFQSDKAALIYQALANELGPVMADALGLSHMQHLDPFSPHFYGPLRDALSRYGAYLANSNLPSPRGIGLADVLRLVRSYRLMAGLARVYLGCTLALLEREVLAAPTLVSAAPSRAEWLRVLRAHYRLQMALPIWHACFLHGPEKKREEDESDANLTLFGLWGPWETQQVLCAGGFYDRFRSRLRHGIADLRLRAEGNPGASLYSFVAWREFVDRARAADEAGWQVVLDKMSSFDGEPDHVAVEETIKLACHRDRMASWGMPWPEQPKIPVSLRFDGDRVTAVPFAWVDAFNGHYGDNYLGVQPKIRPDLKPTQGLWSVLGFVMWDAPRVEALKTSALL